MIDYNEYNARGENSVLNFMNVIITIQILLAVMYDLYCYKVKNIITYTFACLGIAYNLFTGDSSLILSSFMGILVPIALLMPLYLLRVLGAGDIKLFCSIGALLGADDIIAIIVNSFLSGGVIAVFLMLIRQNLRDRGKHLMQYIRNCMLTMDFAPYDDFLEKNGSKMHFTIAIAAGTILFWIR